MKKTRKYFEGWADGCRFGLSTAVKSIAADLERVKMVGGTVIGVSRGNDSTLVNVRGEGPEHHQTLSVRCVERLPSGASVKIQIGDFLWWQSEFCMWTPRDLGARDI